jgi:uncharacterized integral membrane protein (TIGR00697 family)
LTKVRQKGTADLIFLILAGLFIATLVTGNLIANKFVSVDLGFKTFVISAGVLPYPLTFLITDLLSEIFGKKETQKVVIAGFVASLLVVLIVLVGSLFPASGSSPVSDAVYNQTFGSTWRVIAASMTAYLTAQLVDVKVYHFWKRLTNGKMMWVRNNGSTVFSQLIDSILVTTVIFIGLEPAGKITSLILDAWFFKALVALVDTPFLYAITYLIRRQFNLKMGEELSKYHLVENA